MNIIKIISTNKLLLSLLIIGFLLISLKSVGGISHCNVEYILGSCSEVGKVYN